MVGCHVWHAAGRRACRHGGTPRPVCSGACNTAEPGSAKPSPVWSRHEQRTALQSFLIEGAGVILGGRRPPGRRPHIRLRPPDPRFLGRLSAKEPSVRHSLQQGDCNIIPGLSVIAETARWPPGPPPDGGSVQKILQELHAPVRVTERRRPQSCPPQQSERPWARAACAGTLNTSAPASRQPLAYHKVKPPRPIERCPPSAHAGLPESCLLEGSKDGS